MSQHNHALNPTPPSEKSEMPPSKENPIKWLISRMYENLPQLVSWSLRKIIINWGTLEELERLQQKIVIYGEWDQLLLALHTCPLPAKPAVVLLEKDFNLETRLHLKNYSVISVSKETLETEEEVWKQQSLIWCPIPANSDVSWTHLHDWIARYELTALPIYLATTSGKMWTPLKDQSYAYPFSKLVIMVGEPVMPQNSSENDAIMSQLPKKIAKIREITRNFIHLSK